MCTMILIWLLFTLIVLVIEPLPRRRVAAMTAHDPEDLLIHLSASIAFCSRRGSSGSSALWPAHPDCRYARLPMRGPVCS